MGELYRLSIQLMLSGNSNNARTLRLKREPTGPFKSVLVLMTICHYGSFWCVTHKDYFVLLSHLLTPGRRQIKRTKRKHQRLGPEL